MIFFFFQQSPKVEHKQQKRALYPLLSTWIKRIPKTNIPEKKEEPARIY